MDSGDNQGDAFITGVNYGAVDNNTYSDDAAGEMESDEEDQSNKIFNVEDAVPPTDYEAAYS